MIKASFLAGLNEVHYSVMNKIVSSGKGVGVLSDSLTMEMSEGTLYISAHEALFPCGVLVYTDDIQQVSVSDFGLTKSVSKSAWTVCWEVGSNLVSYPQVTLKQGIYQQSGLSDYQIVIGWIVYAGNNANVDTSVVVTSEKESTTILKIAKPYSELGSKSIPSSVTVTESVSAYAAGLTLKNEGNSSVVAELVAFGLTEDKLPGELILSTTTSDVGFTLSAEVATAAGTGVSAGNSATLAAGTATLRFPLSYQKEYFTKWSPFAINLYLRIPALGSVSVNHLIVTSTPRLSVG